VPFQGIVEELLERTGASRVTIRLDSPGDVFPVAAEALGPGVRSIKDATEIDLRAAPTFTFLEREKRNLIQNDVTDAADPPPPELIELYGVRAQMLAPIVQDDRLAGIVSVHYAPSARRWTAADVAALNDAARRAAEALPSS
jgi:GAF domain-containing protein